ncbi:MAG: hypothetical protein ACR2LS_08770 [Thermomicrobiales bacterium]
MGRKPTKSLPYRERHLFVWPGITLAFSASIVAADPVPGHHLLSGEISLRVLPSTVARRSGIRAWPWRSRWMRRIAIVLLIFAVAFVGDTATSNRWTPVWGSTAILISLVVTFPVIRAPLVLGLGYVTVWTAFNGVRAFADDVPWAAARLDAVFETESSLAAGRLPANRLQDAFFDAAAIH